MTTNYDAIGEENRRRYGTDIGRIGPMLLAERYDDRTHFIFELLQNAEDALGRRSTTGLRKVTFALTPSSLTLSHFGRAFDEADVRGVCGIAESTKDQLSIGRFGIGFKSVYTFTDRPEIHSGDEDFAIENYVQPRAASRTIRAEGETQIVLPLRPKDVNAWQEIAAGFRHIGPSALLFLRHIDEINWKVEGGALGAYLRSAPDSLGPNVQRVTLIGHESDKPEVDQRWLVFHREVFSPKGEKVGRTEVAFSLAATKDEPERWSVQQIAASPLVVFFPTVVSTNLGFLVQGPFRTTPSRDNIPRDEPWNQHLIKETANLLVQSLRWMRDKAILDTSALRCLPTDPAKFPEGAMFAPIFGAVRQAFREEALLPKVGGGYVTAGQARLARTQELRELFSADQIEALFGDGVCAWLTADITQDKTPELRKYLMQELGVPEIGPDQVVPRLSKLFLEAQSDTWISRLYAFLSSHKALSTRFSTNPLVRLADGTHVLARANGNANAFLPSAVVTSFPTVRRAVCATAEARGFLVSLGLTEPDPVDDVVWNVLPKYRAEEVNVDDESYAIDVERICTAFRTDSNAQREKLLAALRDTPFVMVVDAGDGKKYVDKPGSVYIATDRLKALYAGVAGIMIVDDNYDCLRGEHIRELLEACGAQRCPRPVAAPDVLTYSELFELRRQTGHLETSGRNDAVGDWGLQGFDALLALLPTLPQQERGERSRLIWESLGDLEDRRGRGIFEGSYSWTHRGQYRTTFAAAFLRSLNKEAWLLDADGGLVPPSLVTFESLGWKANPFLQSKVVFKPPIIDQLAREAGIDPAALDLLRRHGITSAEDLAMRLGIGAPSDDASDDNEENADATEGQANAPDANVRADIDPDTPEGNPSGSGHGPAWPNADNGDPEERSRDDRGGHSPTSRAGVLGEDTGEAASPTDDVGSSQRDPHEGDNAERHGNRFISYLAVHPDDDGPDPDGLDHEARMQIEDAAIAVIISLEPSLLRTPEGNPGFDLYEENEAGTRVRWVEVKSMTASLDVRPVGLSRRQFDEACERGAAYWLYIVEYASDPTRARVLRIQDPAALARTFTFDSGWREVATTVTRPRAEVEEVMDEEARG